MMLTGLLTLGLMQGVHAKTPTPSQAEIDAFVQHTANKYLIDEATVRDGLKQARYKQSIINAITRPAEGKPWKEYRPIFLTKKRIAGGKLFMKTFAKELAKAERETGVPKEMITAIIGVETFYGAHAGKYRVLDALYTLGFFYPKRAKFFSDELSQFFALVEEENLSLTKPVGSYAGAMGWGQFIPSSYRNYAADGNGDGRIDLFNSPHDAIASVANYFKVHGWKPGEPVAVPALKQKNASTMKPENLETRYTLAELAEQGYRPRDLLDAPDGTPATRITLKGQAGDEHWITFDNYYVISRYNRSRLYCMAVKQLAEELGLPKSGHFQAALSQTKASQASTASQP